jgi:simple sugar transport system substrate-binding protein
MKGHRRLIASLAAVMSITLPLSWGLTSASAATAHPSTRVQNSSGSPLFLYLSGPLDMPLTVAFDQGMVAAGKALGVRVEYETPANIQNFVPDYSTLIKEAIGRHPTGLAIGNFFPSSVDPLIKQAVAAGIPVVVVNTGIDTWKSDGAIGFVGEVPSATGEAAGTTAAAAGVHDLLCVNQSPGNPTITQRCASATNQLKSTGGTGAEEDIPLTDSSNPTASTQDIQGYLSSHPSVNGIYTNAAETAVDALAAVKNLGKTGKIMVGTSDLSAAVLQDVQSGSMIFAIDQQPYLQGYLPIQILAQYVKYGFRPTAPIDTGGLVITKANVGRELTIEKAYPSVLGA